MSRRSDAEPDSGRESTSSHQTPVPTQPRIPSSAYKMGVFAAVCMALLGLLAVLIGNVSFAPRRDLHGLFEDATGVATGDRVRLAGVEVGRVTGVELVDDGTTAKVSFAVDEDVPVYRTAHLVLRYENLLGQRYLEIVERPDGSEEVPPGTTFDTEHTTPALSLTVLFNGFQPLFRALDPEQVNTISTLIVQTLQGAGDTYEQLLSATARLTDTLADKDAVIGRVVTNLGAVLRTVDQRDRRLTALIVTFRDLMTGLAADRDRISASLPGLADLLSVSTRYLGAVRPGLRGSVDGLGRVARVLDRDRRRLDASLGRIPFRSRQMARTGSYGTAFNYYLCGASMNLRLLGSDYLLQTPNLSSNERDTICGRRTADLPGYPKNGGGRNE